MNSFYNSFWICFLDEQMSKISDIAGDKVTVLAILYRKKNKHQKQLHENTHYDVVRPIVTHARDQENVSVRRSSHKSKHTLLFRY